MTEQQHIIRRQVLEFRIGASSESFALQQEMARIYNEAIVPLLDEYLSAYSSPETVDKIERLELDLGTLDRNDLRGSFIRKAEAQLAAQLPGILEVLDQRRYHDDHIAFLAGNSAFTVEAGSPRLEQQTALPVVPGFSSRQASDQQQQLAQQPTAELKDGQGSDLELLAYYLQNGHFPWWARETGRAVLERTVLQLLEKYLEALAGLLTKLIQQPMAIKRLILSLDDQVLQRFPAVYLPEQIAAVKKIHTAWKAVPAVRKSATEHRMTWWTTLFTRMFPGQRKAAETSYPLLQVLVNDPELSFEKLLVLLQMISTVFGMRKFDTALKTVRTTVAAAKNAAQTRGSEAQQAQAEADRAVRTLLQQMADASASGTTGRPPVPNPEKQYDAFSESDRVYIGNAGLVLLAGLIPTYFERAELLDENRQWKDDSCRARACVLLHFLVTGDHKNPPLEAELVLNKILCGIPVHTPLDTHYRPTKKEQQLGNDLLKAVIQHWPKIGESSPDALRGNFLLRPGIVSERDGNWLVQVEKRPYDLLLTTFPWNFAVIKLPWNPYLIATEWPY